MANKKLVEQETEQLSSMKELVQAYEEIAVSRMRRVRSSVLQTRDFLGGITKIFQEVKMSYRKEIEDLLKKKKITDKTKAKLLRRNGKSVAVLLSANTGLYGDIVGKTFELFAEHIKKDTSDITIIGKVGKSMFTQDFPHRECSCFDFPDNTVDSSMLEKIIANLIGYNKILVFYSEFQSIVSQKPIILDIYGNEEFSSVDQVTTKTKYFFEPSLEKVVLFFETEIFSSIFEQTLHESNLAKYGSRIFTLDKVTANIEVKLKKEILVGRRIKHRIMNSKQQNALSGIQLWGK